ncbi:MAG: hypothetical protein V4850_13415 [Myxococcota bacterium]
MWVDCPECGAGLEGISGAENVCPACMTPFLVPASARAVRAFDVQPPGDSVLHNLSRYAIREAIYVGRFTASARVRPASREEGAHASSAAPSVAWELIGGYPEFASVFRLLGGDLAPMAGTRKLAGWKQSGAAEASSPRVPRVAVEEATLDADAIPALEATPMLPTQRTLPARVSTVSSVGAVPARVTPPSARPPPAATPASVTALYLICGLILAALLAAVLLLR